jgi:hypothetical protein
MAVWDLNSSLDVFGMQTFLRGLIYVRGDKSYNYNTKGGKSYNYYTKED